MKQAITQASKRWLSLLLAVIMTATMLPLSAISTFAFSTSSGQTVDSAYGAAYVGYDGADYPVGTNHYALRYNSDGSTYIEPSQIGARRTKLNIIQNGEVMQALCIEYGVDISLGTATYVSANSANSAYFNMLPMTARRGIMLATIYGWQPGKALPIDGINEDDFALATQEIIWEYQQGIRTSPTTRVDNGNIRADQFYDEIKGRPAELAYNWILSKMATHATVPSFTRSDRDSAPTHTLKYDAATQKYSLTLTDTNNTGVDIVCTSGSGVSVSRNGNKYTFTSNSMITSAVTLEYKKNISLYGDEFLVWGNVGHQTMMTGVSDPVRFYAAFNTETNGTAKIVKSSEDGVISGISFKITGNGVDQTVTTDASGVASIELLPGTYTVTEQTPNKYVPQQSQNITVTSGQTSTVTFNNVLKRGDVKVTKTAEDGLVSGIKFRLYGTSDSGASVDEYATTDNSGIAMFSDILIGTYTIEEVGTAAKYVTPAKQNVTVKWNEVTSVSFHNELKRGDVKVIKNAEDNFIEGHRFHLYGTSLSGLPVDMYATTDENGVAHFEDVLIGTGYILEEVDTAIRYVIPEAQTADIEWNKVTNRSFENILKKWRVEVYKYDSEFSDRTQGDATLTGAVYGVYDGDELIDTYTTDENGYFITDYYVCGDDWTIREISPSEGYLLDTETHKVGASAKLYTVELSTVKMDVTEDVIKGSISIIKHCDDGSTKIETPEVGAEFKVYLTSAGSYDEAHETERDHLVCDENGYAETKKLPYGTYTVEQIKGWDGREMMKPFTVTITENGKVYRYIINNAVFESYIKIVKVDAETGNTIPYAGAGFKLYRPDGTPITQTFTYPEVTVIDTFYTNDKGYLITPESLEYGTGYYLIEVAAPHGYVLNTDPVYFDVTADGTKDENGIKVVEVTKPNMAQKGIIKLYKTGEVFSSVVETDGIYQPVYSVQGLPGAEYEIRADEDIVTLDGTTRYTAGEVVDTIITDENGYAESKALYLGKYEIKEIKAPHGMVLSDEVHTVELIYAGQEVEITETSAELWNDRQKITVMLDKMMEQDDIFGIGKNGEITSVVFGLYAGEELTATDGAVIPTDGLIEVMTANENGTVVCKSDLPFGSYYLKEITTDEHYVLNETKYSFTFEYAGQDIVVVEIKANDGTPIENELIYGELHGIKKDDGSNAVSGALIGLFRTSTTEYIEENAILTTVSSEDGSFSFVGVPYGKWIVREIKAPTGYILTEESYPVTVNYHGEIIEIEIVNERIRGTVQLTKVDADYPENKLTGAEFEVYRDTNGNKQLDESDELIGKMSEVELGVYSLTDLLYGGYFVKETVAPEGFYLDSTAHYFEITENGETVTVENEAGVGFINTARVGSLKIVKTSSDGKVDGFSFRVTGPNGYDEVFVTNENGEIIIENLRIGEYKVSEVQNEASADYVLPADKMATVFADSTTTLEMYNVFRDTPKTGDDTNLLFWFAMAAVSGTGLVICMVLEMKSRKKRKDDK